MLQRSARTPFYTWQRFVIMPYPLFNFFIYLLSIAIYSLYSNTSFLSVYIILHNWNFSNRLLVFWYWRSLCRFWLELSQLWWPLSLLCLPSLKKPLRIVTNQHPQTANALTKVPRSIWVELKVIARWLVISMEWLLVFLSWWLFRFSSCSLDPSSVVLLSVVTR